MERTVQSVKASQNGAQVRWGLSSRRLLDLAVAGVGLLITSPLVLILAVANRLLTGAIFFKQIRLGYGLQPFVMIKFQTMRSGDPRQSTVTVDQDPRITPFGRWLRILKLDELPQLINVLRGEMSLVGPRPLTPNEINAVPRHLAAVVYRVLPGLTGISAIAFADEERMLASYDDPDHAYFDEVLPRKIALELAYVQRRTWLTDLAVVLFTPLAPFFPTLRRRFVLAIVPDWAALSLPERPAARPGLRNPS